MRRTLAGLGLAAVLIIGVASPAQAIWVQTDAIIVQSPGIIVQAVAQVCVDDARCTAR